MNKPLATFVNGCVLRVYYDEGKATCLVQVDGKEIEVELDILQFPTRPEYGKCFRLEMTGEVGHEKPYITWREPEPANDDLAKQARKILEDWDK